jgi:hypothetical protein
VISPMQGYGAVKRNGSSSKRRSAASERRDSGGAQVMVLKESQASPAVSAPSQGTRALQRSSERSTASAGVKATSRESQRRSVAGNALPEKRDSLLDKASARQRGTGGSGGGHASAAPPHSTGATHQMTQPATSGHDQELDRSIALMERRLRERYGPGGMPEEAIAHLKQLRVDEATGGTKPERKVIGKDIRATVGLIVRHIQRGKHSANHFNGDYLSGDDPGTIISVSGDYAEVDTCPSSVPPSSPRSAGLYV